MKKYIILLLTAIILSGCGITYYSYYEVDSPDLATTISKQDAEWARNHKSPTRVVTTYPDSTGRTVYLMETKVHERIKPEKE